MTSTMLALALLQQDSADEAAAAAAAAGGMGFMLFVLALVIVVVVGMWKVFEKAGVPGWFAIIPIVNAYGLLKVAQRPGWWLILLIIPVVSVIVFVVVCLDVARLFGKSALYGIGLFFLGFIFFPMLGFGDAQYEG